LWFADDELMRSGKLEIQVGSGEAGEAASEPAAPGPAAAGPAAAPATVQVHAYAFATTFRLKDLIGILPGVEVELDKDCLVLHARGEIPPRLAILFDFGALVTIGLPTAERDRLIRAISSRLAPEPHPPLTEDFLLEVRPGGRLEVQFDRVILPEVTLPALKVISLLLAQSVAMDYYEEDVQDILSRSEVITRSLQVAGRLPGRVGDLVKFIGSCIATKNGVIATLALFDKPDAAWEVQSLDRLYSSLRLELELDDRFRALEAKLRMIQENLVLLVDLSQHRSTWRLEVTVVLLILFEVILTLWQMFRGTAHS
jgi:uncharacterized Rmd1/YagE family protein